MICEWPRAFSFKKTRSVVLGFGRITIFILGFLGFGCESLTLESGSDVTYRTVGNVGEVWWLQYLFVSSCIPQSRISICLEPEAHSLKQP